MSDNLYTQFDNVFFEKTRLSMLTVLFKEDFVSFNRFKKVIGGSDGAIYTHLQKLQDAGYIVQKKEIADNKAQTTYRLSPKGKKEFKRYLDFLSSMVLEHK